MALTQVNHITYMDLQWYADNSNFFFEDDIEQSICFHLSNSERTIKFDEFSKFETFMLSLDSKYSMIRIRQYTVFMNKIVGFQAPEQKIGGHYHLHLFFAGDKKETFHLKTKEERDWVVSRLMTRL